MSLPAYFTILAIDPATTLEQPYSYLKVIYGTQCIVTHVQSIDEALRLITQQPYSLVTLSSHLNPFHSLEFLEELKNQSRFHLTPLIFVIDWNQRIHRILGTQWGGQIGVWHTLSSLEEVTATLKRLHLLQLPD